MRIGTMQYIVTMIFVIYDGADYDKYNISYDNF